MKLENMKYTKEANQQVIKFVWFWNWLYNKVFNFILLFISFEIELFFWNYVDKNISKIIQLIDKLFL